MQFDFAHDRNVSKKVGSNFLVFSKPSDTFGRDISYHDGHQICNNYNWARGCIVNIHMFASSGSQQLMENSIVIIRDKK